MELPTNGWKNKNGTSDRICNCGSWKQHWLNFSGELWPCECSVIGCDNEPNLGAHVINSEVDGERIVPMCFNCNKLTTSFTLKENVTCVRANVSITCGK